MEPSFPSLPADPAAPARGGPDEGAPRPADAALRVLFVATLIMLGSSFLSGALSTHMMAVRLQFDGSRPPDWIASLLPLLHLASLGADAASIYALFLLARVSAQVAPLAHGALACTAVGLLTGLGYLASPDLTYGLVGGAAASALLTLIDLAGVALILAVLLRLGGRTVDAPAAAFLAVLLLRQIVTWTIYRGELGRSLREGPWTFFALRQALSFAQHGLFLWLVMRARGDVARAAPAQEQTTAGAPMAMDDHASGLRMLIFGTLWLLGGAGVTIASYAAASSSTGGRYVVAYGAVVYGAVQIVRGVARMARAG